MSRLDAERVQIFLLRVSQEIPLSPREYDRFYTLLKAVGHSREELRNASAALFATDREQVPRIHALFDQCLGAESTEADASSSQPPPKQAAPPSDVPKPEPPPTPSNVRTLEPLPPDVPSLEPARTRERAASSFELQQLLRRIGPEGQRLLEELARPLRLRRVWVVTGVVMIGLVVWRAIPESRESTPTPISAAPMVTRAPTPVTGPIVTQVAEARSIERKVEFPPVTLGQLSIGTLLGALAVFFLLSWLAGMLLLSLLRLPHIRRQHSAVAEVQALKDREHFAKLEVEAQGKQSCSSQSLDYFVGEQVRLLSSASVADTASLLGRVFDTRPGDELDFPSTLHNTLETGGQSTLAWLKRPSPHDLVVLVDVEGGDHPWLGGFEHLLNDWAAQGIRLVRYHFYHTPDSLSPAERNERTTLARVLQAHEGAPVIVFSRLLPAMVTERTPAWLLRLGSLERCGWLDPHPHPLQRRKSKELEGVETLRQGGLRRFPLTREGVSALAMWLAGQDSGHVPDYVPLPGIDHTRRSEALERWTFAAALVPDASWAQLQQFRRKFPEIRHQFPEPQHLQCLLDHLSRRADGTPITKENGRKVSLPESLRHDILRQDSKSAYTSDGQPMEPMVRRLLVEQLCNNAPPIHDALRYKWWQLKVAVHEALLDKEHLDVHLRGHIEGPHRIELRAMMLEAYELYGPRMDAVARRKLETLLSLLANPNSEGEEGVGLASVPGKVAQEGQQLARVDELWAALKLRQGWIDVLIGAVGFAALGALVVGHIEVIGSFSLPDRMALATLEATKELKRGIPAADFAPLDAASPAPLAKLTPAPAPKRGNPVAPRPHFTHAPVKTETVPPATPEIAETMAASTAPPPVTPPLVSAETTPPSIVALGTPPLGQSTPFRPAMVTLPTGSFMMGSPEKEADRDADEGHHSVEITVRFALARTEVTQAQYEAVMGKNPSIYKGVSNPVDNVTWFDAVNYSNALSEKEGLDTCYEIDGKSVRWPRKLGCRGYRLPTEAEWEYAARAGTPYLYVGTSNIREICDFSNLGSVTVRVNRLSGGPPLPGCSGTDCEGDGPLHSPSSPLDNQTDVVIACDGGFAGVAPVASKKINSWGLYDMGGNVWEWTWNWYGSYGNDSEINPVGPDTGEARSRRGGSWLGTGVVARVAYRAGWAPWRAGATQGFRIARSVP